MGLRLWTRIVVTVALASGANIGAQQPSAMQTGTGVIEGRVANALTGHPIEGAHVRVAFIPADDSTDDIDELERVTGPDGAFRVEQLRAGEFIVRAFKSEYLGWGPGERSGDHDFAIQLAKGQRAEAQFRLWPSAILGGVVRDEDDKPVAGATVRLIRRFGADRIAETATNDRGEYSAETPPGEYLVVIPQVRLTLPADEPIACNDHVGCAWGHQTSSDGRFVSYFINHYSIPPPPEAADHEARNIVTTFHPNATSVARAAIVRVGYGDRRTDIDIQLVSEPSFAVGGSVVGPDGRPWPDVRLELIADADSLGVATRPKARPDAAGSFRFLSVPPGRYLLNVTREVYGTEIIGGRSPGMWTQAPVQIDNHDISGLDLVLHPSVTVAGRFAFDTPPHGTTGFSVRLDSERGDGRFVHSADRPRDFAFPGITPGAYRVRTEQPEGWALKSVSLNGQILPTAILDVGASDVTGLVATFTNRPTAVTGEVRDAQGRPSTAGCAVIFPADRRSWQNVGFHGSPAMQLVRLSDAGTYAFSGLPPGDYLLTVIDLADVDAWPDPSFLETLEARATRLRLADGEQRVQSLQIRRR